MGLSFVGLSFGWGCRLGGFVVGVELSVQFSIYISEKQIFAQPKDPEPYLIHYGTTLFFSSRGFDNIM